MDIQNILPTDQTIETGKLMLYVINTSRTTVGVYSWQPLTVIVPGVLEFPAGWYDSKTGELAIKKFGYGEGFQVYAEVPVALTYSGQVKADSPKFTAATAGYYRCANITPVEVDIQNIIPTAEGVEQIETGKVMLYTYGANRSNTAVYSWQPLTVIVPGVLEFPAGWYDSKTGELAIKKFGAADGFVLYTELAKTTLTFPNPLGENK